MPLVWARTGDPRQARPVVRRVRQRDPSGAREAVAEQDPENLHVMTRPPREAYVRAKYTPANMSARHVEIDMGLEYRPGDDVHAIRHRLKEIAGHGRWVTVPSDVPDMQISDDVEDGIMATWPDRAYFIEVSVGGEDGWTQVFAPFGLPRSAG